MILIGPANTGGCLGSSQPGPFWVREMTSRARAFNVVWPSPPRLHIRWTPISYTTSARMILDSPTATSRTWTCRPSAARHPPRTAATSRASTRRASVTRRPPRPTAISRTCTRRTSEAPQTPRPTVASRTCTWTGRTTRRTSSTPYPPHCTATPREPCPYPSRRPSRASTTSSSASRTPRERITGSPPRRRLAIARSRRTA